MQCPVCPQTPLVMSERQGVEIDYCPKCRGVWLDRGELDKILERAASERPAQAPAQQAQPAQPAYAPRERDHDDRYRADRDREYNKSYRKKSIWHEIFD